MARTQEELKQVALDLFHNAIFTDRHCRNPEEVRMVFAIFMFMDEEQIKQIQENPPGMIYEYYTNALPRSCNGLPMFLSAHMLSQEEAKTVTEMYIKLNNATKEALK